MKHIYYIGILLSFCCFTLLFFSIVEYRDPLISSIYLYKWFILLQMVISGSLFLFINGTYTVYPNIKLRKKILSVIDNENSDKNERFKLSIWNKTTGYISLIGVLLSLVVLIYFIISYNLLMGAHAFFDAIKLSKEVMFILLFCFYNISIYYVGNVFWIQQKINKFGLIKN